MTPSLFDRGGHLTELGLDRLRSEPERLDPAQRTAADAHLAACALCRDARAALASADLALPLPHLRQRDPVAAVIPLSAAARRRRAPWVGLGLGTLVALAAALVLVVRSEPVAPPELATPDAVRLKGNPFVFSVWIHDGDAAAMAARDGFEVRAGQRMGFTVQTDADGHLLVVGRDDTGQRYACFPQVPGPDGRLTAAPLPAQRTPFTLPGAMAFDATPGDEHLLAVLCPGPFGEADLPADAAATCPPVIDVGGQRCLARCQRLSKASAMPEAGGGR